MKPVVLLLALVMVLIAACHSDKLPKIEDEFCDCLHGFDSLLSDETIKMYKTVEEGYYIDLETGMSKEDSVATHKLMKVSKMLEEDTVYLECLKKHEAKYGTFSIPGKEKELLRLLESRSDCRSAIFFLKVGLQNDKTKHSMKVKTD
jgi:hypothetical protein